MNLNKVILAGHLTRDVELRHTQGGKAIGKFGIAVNEKWKTPEGEQREKVAFVDCVAWGRAAEVLAQYVKKGSPLFIEGRLEYSSWTTQDGQKRNKLEVTVEQFQFLGGKRDDEDEQPRRASGSQRRSGGAAKGGEPDYGDIPF